jgi:putative radical SAM enzyme (TIGR03279 family)
MSVKISDVKRFSLCWLNGVRAGDSLTHINGCEIEDVLDYDFYMNDLPAELSFLTVKGKKKTVKITEKNADNVGLEFETYLMDKQHSCRNKCIFCFVDQLPKGMRDTLYFKDDDSRLSFLFGNYITLTNLSEHETQRIIDMHISPVNISVHTMNPELRVEMMKNKNAGESLKLIKRFADAGISMNTQLVLCPEINDGKELEYSLKELSALYPAVQSIAAVPVGITKFRDGLYPIKPYTKERAGETIDIIERFGDDFYKEHGTRLAYPADEFYLKAQRPLPCGEFYEDYPQLDNGVGMWTLFKEEFENYLETTEIMPVSKTLSCAAGVAAYPLIAELCDKICAKCDGLKINVYEIKNDFFGENITVAGLIVGQDLINQLKGKDLGEYLIISASMVKGTYPEKVDGVFLDDMTYEQAKNELKTDIKLAYNDGAQFAKIILGVD